MEKNTKIQGGKAFLKKLIVLLLVGTDIVISFGNCFSFLLLFFYDILIAAKTDLSILREIIRIDKIFTFSLQ